MTHGIRNPRRLLAFLSIMFVLAGCNLANPKGGGTEGEGLTGVMVDAQGAPVPGAWVRAYPADTTETAAPETVSDTLGDVSPPATDSALTDETGTFRLTGLEEGTYDLIAEARRRGEVLSLYLPGVVYTGERLDLGTDTLRTAGSVTLQVTGEGEPLDNALCRIAGAPWLVVSGETGTCDLIELPPGVYRITVSHPSFETAVSGLVTIAPGGAVSDLTLNLVPIPLPGPADRHFEIFPSTVALWTFNAQSAGRFQDAGPHAFTLSGEGDVSLASSPFGSALSLTGDSGMLRSGYDALLSPLETGRMTLDARVRLEEYPEASTGGGAGHVAGMGNGLNLEITHDGRLQTSFTQGPPGGSVVHRTYRSDSLAVPLETWVDLAVAVDARPDTVLFYAYVDGEPVTLYGPLGAGELSQEEEDLTIGNDGSGARPFSGLIDEVRISNTLVHGPGLPMAEDTTQPVAFEVTPETVALWRFTAHDEQNRVPDLGPNGFHLSPTGTIPSEASPFDSAAVFDGTSKRFTASYDDRFNVGITGQITYEARIHMTEYPATGNFKNRATVMGMYAGPALQIHDDGTLTVKNQKLNGTTAYWYDTLSTLPNTVPLDEWVNVAISVDASVSPKQVYAYVNGVPVQLYGVATTDEFRIYTEAPFAIGDDTRDIQPFRGRIEGARVSNALVLGAGLPILPKPPGITFPLTVTPTTP